MKVVVFSVSGQAQFPICLGGWEYLRNFPKDHIKKDCKTVNLHVYESI